MIIDIHAHIVDPVYMQQLRDALKLEAQHTEDGKTLYRHQGYTIAWERPDMYDIDFRLKEMDRKGINMRVLSLSTPNVYCWPEAEQIGVTRQINDALADLCRAHPDRFVGLGSLPLANVEESLSELDRCVNELGMKGVMIGSNIDGAALNDAKFEPLWARLNELKLPVYEHPMFPKDTTGLGEFELPLRVGLIFDTTLVATRLIYSGVFERYPDFPYIMGHTGGALLMLLARLDNGYKLFPDCREFISRPPSEFARNLYYDTCSFDPESLMFAHRQVGASQILFGTDDPFIDADTGHVARLGMTPAEKARILGDNAARLLGI
jgi:aminocarboxymuconate-semialdehyde decarboxylase